VPFGDEMHVARIRRRGGRDREVTLVRPPPPGSPSGKSVRDSPAGRAPSEAPAGAVMPATASALARMSTAGTPGQPSESTSTPTDANGCRDSAGENPRCQAFAPGCPGD
jgi:hypothetical protein